MKEVFVWVLMTLNPYGDYGIMYSPPVADLPSCERMKRMHVDMLTARLDRAGGDMQRYGRCVQITVTQIVK